VAGSFSVDFSDETIWRDILAEEGFDIPIDAPPNTWLAYGTTRLYGPQQTEDFVRSLRSKYYQRLGVNTQRKSISEYVESNIDVVQTIFNNYFPALGTALHTGNNNETMQGLALSILDKDLDKMKFKVRSQLIRVANSKLFDSELGRTMEAIIRYAAVEILRKGLVDFINPNFQPELTYNQPMNIMAASTQNPKLIHQFLATNVETGVTASRPYGGCQGEIQLSNEAGANESGNSPQEAYGGLGNGNNSEKRIGKIRIDKCVVLTCPTRPNKVKVGGCGVCLGRCQKLFDAGQDPTKM
jgi:hypothetical protein